MEDKTPPCVYFDSRGVLELTNFQEGFREALPYWLNQVFSTTLERVERAVQVDQVISFFSIVVQFLCLVSLAVIIKSTVFVFSHSSNPCRPVLRRSNTAPQPWTWWHVSSLSANCGRSSSGLILKRPSCSWWKLQRWGTSEWWQYHWSNQLPLHYL